MLLLFQGGWIQSKAWLAQLLLEQAWQQTLADGGRHRPWPWADHWPVASLSADRLAERLVVLEGDSGAVLAFAPGRAVGSGMPAGERTMVISGHRDTHFRFLEAVRIGDQLVVETQQGTYRYRVEGAEVLDSRQHGIALREDGGLVLVTCWPFDATAVNGPMRYVVSASRAM